MIAWFNGELLPLDGVAIRATDRGFLLGDGLFETMAANQGKVAHFDRHMARLKDSAKLMGLPLPYSADDILRAIHDVLTGCQLKESRAALRLTISRGPAPRGLMPPANPDIQVLINASPSVENLPAAKLVISPIRRNETSPTSQIKSLCYLDNIFAMKRAQELGGDEALMFNTKGRVCEGSISNVFFIIGDSLYTPPTSEGCLPGIMRVCVMEEAAKLGMTVREEPLGGDILQRCEAAFLTNSLMRVRPICQIGERELAQSPWCNQLLDAVKACED